MSDLPPPLPGNPAGLPRNKSTGGPSRLEDEPEGHRFPCHTCGGNLRYRPGTPDLVCPHCGAVEPIPGAGRGHEANAELDFRKAVANLLPASDMQDIRTVSCPNCGAVVEFSGADHAAKCPYCATAVVVDTGAQRQIKPKGLLPFALDEAQARKRLQDWLGSLWFAPNGVKEYARSGRAMDGIYVPYWTFDADTVSDYAGERGDAYYVTRTVMRNGKQETVQERRIRWSSRHGRVARFFDDVLVIASKSMPKRYVAKLEPWDLQNLQDYRPEYLAGYRAEGYTVELNEGMAEAKEMMDQVIRQDVRRDIGGDEQRIHGIETQFGDITFKHVLLPIYLAAYKYSGKSYQFVINARTGEVQGERPYSAWKIAAAVIVGLILAMLIAAIYAQR